MNVKQLERFPPGNPFLHDQLHTGTFLGPNVVVMTSKCVGGKEEQDYIIVCNKTTGERVRIDLTEKASDLAEKHDTFDQVMGGQGQQETNVKCSMCEDLVRVINQLLAESIALQETTEARRMLLSTLSDQVACGYPQ